LPTSIARFTDLDTPVDNPAAAAATIEALDDKDPTDLAMIATIYEPEGCYQDGDILNIETSLDIFGPSTTKSI
jgi:hypothetical protein